MNTKYSNLTIKQLVNMCLLDDKGAWNEFFRRYTPVIYKSIKRALVAKDLSNLAYDIHNIRDIYLEVFDLVWLQKGLSTLKDADDCEAWLKVVSIRKTIDWGRRYNRRRNLAKKQAEESMLYFSAPQNEDGSVTLGDQIPDPQPFFPVSKSELHEYIKEFKRLPVKELWALRIRVMFYDPFTAQEIIELSKYLKRPVEEITLKLEKILKYLLDKNEAKEKARDSGGRIHSIVMDLQGSLLRNRSKKELSEDDRKRICNQIDRREKSLKAVRASSAIFIEPANQQIADLMGIPADKAQGVSLLVHRARKKIQEALKIRLKYPVEIL